MFHFGSKSSRRAKAEEPALQTVGVPAETDAPTVKIGATSTQEVVELLEADLKRSGKRMETTGRETKARVGETVKIVEELRVDTDRLVEQTGAAKQNMAALADGFHELQATAEEIGRRAETSQRLVDEAIGVAAIASRSVADLKVAIEQIQAVVALIADVAGQTNLLALNATIEAARAGPAGRGFAVVANEVKALSVETQKATTEIGSTIGRLRTTAEANIQAVDRIIGLVGEIGPVFGEVTQSVQMQIGTTAEIGQSAAETARFAEEVAERAHAMSAGMARAAELGREVDSATDVMNGTVADMTRQLVTVLRQTPEADRRRHDRWPVELRGEMQIGANRLRFHTIDLSLGGALVVPEGPEAIPNGSRLEMDVVGLCRLIGTVVARSAHGLHVKFSDGDPAAEAQVRAKIATLDAEYRPMIHRAERAAERIRGVIEAAVDDGSLAMSDLFDTNYRAIKDSAPVQYETRGLKALESILPPVQEAILVEDERMAFCAAVDVNGWLPVHNKIYSQPQRPGDVLWNTANSRNRRIYDDRTGLLAARNTRSFLVQAYMRDLGGGNIVAMKEIDIPLVVKGRHWGGFRTAYRM
ncbi:MAG: methyl-accepting chemotaxis protein [Hyphomicrobiales bacterium]|nr:methyl-accepting chemotaxis protein [Hyphomicrobiales bacterium]